MNRLQDTYGDVAEFFVVYIREAHAADSKWPITIQGEDPINEPVVLTDRRAVASKCVTKLNLKLPCLIDRLDNAVDKAYSAHPDRLFVVDSSGKIVVRGDPGPWGFAPAVEDATEWLRTNFPDVASDSSSDSEVSDTS